MQTGKLAARIGIGAVALLAGIQLVPYGRDHENPKVTREVGWPDETTRKLVDRACMDCHSNRTRWPWYASVAPISWFVYRDVVTGRKHLNFTEWDREQEGSDNTSEMVKRGKMPYPPYKVLHPEARLTEEEKQQLIRGLEAIIAAGDPGPDAP